jgi:hypothetical protein
MLTKLINLTLLLVIYEIERLLKEYPEQPYQVAFSSQELRQKLILGVLNQLPNYYVLLEEGKELPTDPTCLYHSFEEQILMEVLIRKSIVHLLEENADYIINYMAHQQNSANEPS